MLVFSVRHSWSAIFVLAVVLTGVELSPCPAPPKAEDRAFGLEEIITGQLSARGFNGRWISGTEFIYGNSSTGDVIIYDVTTEGQTVLVEKSVLEEYKASSYELSADQLFLMLRYDEQPGFRHSSSAKCVLYDLTTREYLHVANMAILALVTWSPVDHSLAFVLDNNIWHRDAAGAERQITTSGVPGVVYNGVADWVYEEEVLGSGSALWFSPDGRLLAFAEFNDNDVKVASYFLYGSPGTMESQYAQEINLRYPKPGTTNPDVSLKVVDLTSLAVVDLAAPVAVVSADHILAEVTWANQQVSAVWQNRVQNILHIVEYDATNGSPGTTFTVTENAGWIDIFRPLYDSTGASFLTLLSQPQDGAGNYRQLSLVTNGVAVALTLGQSVVTDIYGWDEDNGIIYYRATPENVPSQRHVYAVTTDSVTPPVCLSCTVKTVEDNDCVYASASFSKDNSYYALSCSGPDPNSVILYRTENAEMLTVWEDNAALREKIKDRKMPTFVDTDVDVAGGFKAKTRLVLPPDADLSGNIKYPMLVFVYAGPNSQQITDAFSLNWGTYLATNRSVIYCLIDGRGSGMKGDDILFTIYKGMGTVEIEDQIAVARELQLTHSYIDSTRMAIWGWSYGGYATAMALALDDGGVFKCGASVAPVTSWIYYDTIYTERYMRLPTPEDNLAGYNISDVTRRVDNFRNKDFYLLHGNADDNVHYQQSMMLSRALEEADILFRQQSYPDENHSIRGTILHVYHSMDRFWTDCFDL